MFGSERFRLSAYFYYFFCVFLLGHHSTAGYLLKPDFLVDVFQPFTAEDYYPVVNKSSLCYDTFRAFAKNLIIGEKWALQVVDTWGSPPSGMLDAGGSGDFGHFDGCINEIRFRLEIDGNSNSTSSGKFVLVESKLGKNVASIGICLPSVCVLSEEIEWLLHKIMPQMGLYGATIKSIQEREAMPWSEWEQNVTWFLIASVALVVIGACCELLVPGGRLSILKAFSIVRNSRELFTFQDRNGFGCLDGIKVLAFLQIAFGHVINSNVATLQYNKANYFHDTRFFMIAPLHVGADTFFLISGLLLSYLYMRDRNKGEPFNVVDFYFRRYLRLMPAMFVMNVVLAAYMVHIESPTSHLLSYGLSLRFTWLKNAYDGQLWYHLWYINAELVLLLVAPLFLYFLWRYGYRMFPVIVSVALFSAGYYYHQLELNRLKIIPTSPSFSVTTRCAPWLFGLLLGYLIYKRRQQTDIAVEKVNTSKDVIKTVMRTLISLLSVVIMLLDIYAQQTSYAGSAYMASSRIIWNLSLSWLLYWMISGEHLVTLSRIFSHSSLQLLAHLTYSAYLWHVPLSLISTYIDRTPTYTNAFLEVQKASSITALALMIAIPWALLFELPYKNLQRVLFGGQLCRLRMGWRRRSSYRFSQQLPGKQVSV